MTSTAEAPKVVQLTPPVESLVITHTQNHEAYNCPEKFCTFTTSSPSLLGLHKAQVHKIKSGIKKGVTYQYFCPAAGCHFNPQSGRFFKVLDHLKTHYMKVHCEKNFECSKCHTAFGLERDCLRHEKLCGQTFTCTECGKEYTKKTSLNMHCLTKGHKPPACLQKAPSSAKVGTKISITKSPPKEKKMATSMVPILPKFPLPCTMSILIPTQKITATQSLYGTLDAMKQVSLDSTQQTNIDISSKQAENGINKILIKADLPKEICRHGNSSPVILFNKDTANSTLQPYVTLFSSEGMHGNSVSEKLPVNSSLSVITVNNAYIEETAEVSKARKSKGKRQSQKHLSNDIGLPATVASLNEEGQTDRIFTSKSQRDEAEQENSLSSSSTTSPQTSQSEPLSKKLKALPSKCMVPVSNFPSTVTNHLTPPCHHSSVKVTAQESLNPDTALRHMHENRISNVCQKDYCRLESLDQNDSSSHPLVQRKIISKPRNSNDMLEKAIVLSHLHFPNADTDSFPTSNQNCNSLSSSQTQTCIPCSSDLVHNIETQTLESFLLDSLNNLLSDCETQTFESSYPPYNLLSDIETQTFEGPPLINTLVNDNETQTNESSLVDYYGLVNNIETQTLESAGTLNQLLNGCESDVIERSASAYFNFLGESCTQTSLKTTSDSITQTLDTIMSDSTAQTSTDMYGVRENICSLERPINFPSADISCQVDIDDLFMGDTLTTFDIMTQTLNDYNLNSSNLPLITTAQTLSVRETGIQTINDSMTSATEYVTSTRPSGSQNIMTQTTNDLLTSSQTKGPNVSESSDVLDSMQLNHRFGTSMQNFSGLDMPSSLFDSFDSWTNSVELPDSAAEAMKIFSSGNQGQKDINSTDAVTQTLCQNFSSHPPLSIMDIDTQTQELCDTTTQTLKSSLSAESVPSQTQRSLHMFDSMTQTQAFDATAQPSETFDSMTQTMTPTDFDALNEIADELLYKSNDRQNTGLLESLSPTANNLGNISPKFYNFDTMTQTFSTLDNTTQTANDFELTVQTDNSTRNMTHNMNSFDTMTQTLNSFDNMTQTTKHFEISLQTDNTETSTQTGNSLDTMTQTACRLDPMVQPHDLLDFITQTGNSHENTPKATNRFETMTQTPHNHSAMTQTAGLFDSFDLGCEMFTQTEEMKSVWEMTTQTEVFPVQGSDITTQTVDDGLWEMMTQTENDLMSDMMTQTGPDDLSEDMTSQTDKVQGSDQMTQTADRDLWKMMTQTEAEVVSDMMTQTGESSNLWQLCSSQSLDMTSNIFTQTESNGLWEAMAPKEDNTGSDVMTQTQGKGLWEMTTQTDETTNKDLWETTTQTDEIMECDMMTQTMDDSFGEALSQPGVDFASDNMTQTAEDDFWEIAPSSALDEGCDTFTQTDSGDLWEIGE